MNRVVRFSAALAAAVSINPVALADPLHMFAKQDGYFHHGSGWIFPRDVGPFRLRGSATQLDGNDDVSGEYLMERNDARSTAFVDVYYPTSAAVGAKLDTARAAVLSSVGKGCEPSQSEAKFTVAQRPDIEGLKVVFEPKAGTGCELAELYFFRTPKWVITVRATAPAKDAAAGKALDEFVQSLRWDSLDTDPFEHDPSP